jgi:hypothetical protein
MVDSLVLAVTAQPTAGRAWRSLVGSDAVVGIKVSASAGLHGGTRVAVVEAVAAGLREAGLPRERILVWDRDLSSLLAAGYRKDAKNYTLRWIDAADGYDEESQVSAPVLGRLIWGDSRFGRRSPSRLADLLASGDQLSSQSYYGKILSRTVSKVINIPSALDSTLTGIHGAIANMTLPNLDNWRRFVKEPHHGDPFLAEIYADAVIRDKVVLTILDALFVQYAGGPFPNPSGAVDNGALFASRDPVAIDATLLEMIEELRISSKLPSARERGGHVETAARFGLGNSAPSRIETLRAGGSASSLP